MFDFKMLSLHNNYPLYALDEIAHNLVTFYEKKDRH